MFCREELGILEPCSVFDKDHLAVCMTGSRMAVDAMGVKKADSPYYFSFSCLEVISPVLGMPIRKYEYVFLGKIGSI